MNWRGITIHELELIEPKEGDKLITYDPVSDYRLYEGVRNNERITFKVKGIGKKRVYLLYDYEEHGIESFFMRGSIEEIEEILKSHLTDPEFHTKYAQECLNKFYEIRDNLKPGEQYPLSTGWGGYVLLVDEIKPQH